MDTPLYHLEKLVRSKKEEPQDFLGPLDLILHLLSKNKIEIRDIPVAQILEQYLAWMAERAALDMDIASEFIAMAAHLLYIKSRMLLSLQDEEAESEVALLIADLEARRSQEAFARLTPLLPLLEDWHRKNAGCYPGPRKQLPGSARKPDYRHKPAELVTAMTRILHRNRDKAPPPLLRFRALVGREPYPLEKKIGEISARLRNREQLQLSALLAESASRSELIAVFIVVLELCRNGALWLDEREEDCYLRPPDYRPEQAAEV